MVMQLAKAFGVSPVCRILSVPRSTVYYPPHARADTARFEQAVQREAGQQPAEGSRRLAAHLRRQSRWAHTGRERVRRALHWTFSRSRLSDGHCGAT